jgi:hypothetical protein
MVPPDASERIGNSEIAIPYEIFGLLFVLIEVRTGG